MLVDNGYTTILHLYSGRVDVYNRNHVALTSSKLPLSQGWRNVEGLWMVPMANINVLPKSLDIAKSAMSMYDLPLTREVIQVLHAVLGFLQKQAIQCCQW